MERNPIQLAAVWLLEAVFDVLVIGVGLGLGLWLAYAAALLLT